MCKHGLRQLYRQQGVDLDGHDPRRDLQQAERQRPETGADLDHDVVGPDAGRAHQAPDGVGVDDEVLPEALGRPQPEAGRERANLTRGQQAQRYLPQTGHGARPSRW